MDCAEPDNVKGKTKVDGAKPDAVKGKTKGDCAEPDVGNAKPKLTNVEPDGVSDGVKSGGRIKGYSSSLSNKSNSNVKQGDLSFKTWGSLMFYVVLGVKNKHKFYVVNPVILEGKAKVKSIIVKPNNEVS